MKVDAAGALTVDAYAQKYGLKINCEVEEIGMTM